MRQKFFRNEPLYPECMAQKEWNTNDIREEILKWKHIIMNNVHLHWFHDSSSEPLDPINPRIQVTFDQLIGRKGFEKLKVIFTLFKVYFLNFLFKFQFTFGIISINKSMPPSKRQFPNFRLEFMDPTANYSMHGWSMGKLMLLFQMKLQICQIGRHPSELLFTKEEILEATMVNLRSIEALSFTIKICT